ncbi:hypothetical protein OIU84_010127 [Salix udensis]|uniref:Uncharacterized protein n=1 Tax=Salix udensis TaxID=889485 RepID=A0AAD6JK47_9ROSI|nr:hypothetical protein OIU84_010127 [Salix udensis]
MSKGGEPLRSPILQQQTAKIYIAITCQQMATLRNKEEF